LSVPTDCPQRDERYGWTADAQVFWKTAGYFMDVSAFLTKWMLDIADGQSPDGAFPDVAPTKPLNPYRLTPQPGAPGWGDAPVILSWEHWLRYADRDLLERHWPSLDAWAQHIVRANPDFLRRKAVYNNYGDWLSVGPASDRTLIATAYWYRVADLMARMARVLGRKTEAARHRQIADAVKGAFLAAFVDPLDRLSSDTQTAYLLAVDFDLLPERQRNAAAHRLIELIEAADGHLQTGFLGVRHLLPVLTKIGRCDLAVAMLLKDTYPSWGFSIAHGATTIWERWDGWTPQKSFQSSSMNSFNHYAYGSVGEWIWSRLAGIDTDEDAPGYARIRFAPIFDQRIGKIAATYQSCRGQIGSSWEIANDQVTWTVNVPANASAEIELPPNWRRSDGETAWSTGAGQQTITAYRK
jgi:alpha-L-rhamnosidase